MVLYSHGSIYFQTDVSLFISFSFLHLDCVSQRTCPNLLMASKAIDLLMLDVQSVTVQMDKINIRLPQPARVAANLL